MNEKPIVAYAAAGGLAMVAVLVLIWSYSGSTGARPDESQAFFSVDDGKNYFLDNNSKTAPFDHKGQPAMRLIRYQLKDGSKVSGYLQRKKASATPARELPPGRMDMSPREVKKPGDSAWVLETSPAGAKVTALPEGAAIIEP